MTLTNWIITYVAGLVAFLIIDLVWLGVIARSFYRDRMGALVADSPKMIVAGVFYCIFVIGIMYFAVNPAIGGDWTLALRNGALYGFFTYVTYDLTCWSVMKNYPGSVAIVDIIWGVVLASSVTMVAWRVASSLNA